MLEQREGLDSAICSLTSVKAKEVIMDWDLTKMIEAEHDQHLCWIKETVEICKCAPSAVNQDWRTVLLSHT